MECHWENSRPILIPQDVRLLQEMHALLLFELFEPGYAICWAFLSLSELQKVDGVHYLQLFEYQRSKSIPTIFDQFRSPRKRYEAQFIQSLISYN